MCNHAKFKFPAKMNEISNKFGHKLRDIYLPNNERQF